MNKLLTTTVLSIVMSMASIAQATPHTTGIVSHHGMHKQISYFTGSRGYHHCVMKVNDAIRNGKLLDKAYNEGDTWMGDTTTWTIDADGRTSVFSCIYYSE